MKTIIKQTWGQMKQQPLLTVLSILGTSLAVCLIMVEVMLRQVQTVPFAPESNRDRLLHVKWMSATKCGCIDDSNNGPMSIKTAKECFFSLRSAEAVSAYTRFSEMMQASVSGQAPMGVDIKQVDDGFFRIFNYTFVVGKPISKAQSDAGQAVAVISSSVARALYGTINVEGKEIDLNHVPYRICGVVNDVNPLAETAYSQIWIPYNSTEITNTLWDNGGIMGLFSVVILAHNSKDFDTIRQECEKLRVAYNRSVQPDSLFYRGQPDSQEAEVYHNSANNESFLKQENRNMFISLLILLIIPAVNLSSMTQSRLRRRIAEIGVRRAFGATRSEIMQQVVMENLMLTFAGGLVGLIFCWIVSYVGSAELFTNMNTSMLNVAPAIDPWVLFNPRTFIWVLLICFILNLLSSVLPAWKASKAVIVNALGSK